MTKHSTLSTLAACLTLSLAALALTGCSSNDNAAPPPSFSCATKGPCPGDPTPTADQASSCEALENDATCGPAFKAYSVCAFSIAICSDAGLSDPTADSTSSACNSEYATYTTCLGNKMNDAGNRGRGLRRPRWQTLACPEAPAVA